MKTIFKVFLSRVTILVYSFIFITIFTLSLTTYAQNRSVSAVDISLTGPGVSSHQLSIEGNVLYDQTLVISGEHEAINSQQNDPPWTDFDCQGADDFVVPELEKWEITDVVAIGEYYNGPGPALVFNIYFYEDDAGVPGTEIIALLDQAYTDDSLGAFTVNLSDVVELQPGKYWVFVQVHMENHTDGQWSWQEYLEPILDQAVWQNPPDGYGTGFIAWTPIQSLFPGWVGSGFAYALLGTPNIVSVENEANGPLTFALEQNYPNPFNPTTKIKYAISQQNYVTLKVYDILGREVAALVSEQKVAGIYEVNFDASLLSSATYFYRLQAGNFVETKKMILLR